MRCPNCKGLELQANALVSELSANSCYKCDGTSLPIYHYCRWAKTRIQALHFSTANHLQPLSCPRCTGAMLNYQVEDDPDNLVAVCQPCKLVWLNQQQWQVLKKFYLASAFPLEISKRHAGESIAPPAYPNHVHFQRLLGSADYQTAMEFKLWLKRHPHQHDIMHFLNQAAR